MSGVPVSMTTRIKHMFEFESYAHSESVFDLRELGEAVMRTIIHLLFGKIINVVCRIDGILTSQLSMLIKGLGKLERAVPSQLALNRFKVYPLTPD